MPSSEEADLQTVSLTTRARPLRTPFLFLFYFSYTLQHVLRDPCLPLSYFFPLGIKMPQYVS